MFLFFEVNDLDCVIDFDSFIIIVKGNFYNRKILELWYMLKFVEVDNKLCLFLR